MQQQDSYADFRPLRQSSMLTDETLLMNGTDVYADVSVVWPAIHQARELERARVEYLSKCDSLVLADTLPNDNTAPNFDESTEETIWMTALDTTFLPEPSTDANNQSMFDVCRSVLDYMGKRNKSLTNDKMNTSLKQQSLNDTLPMDNELLNDTLPMDKETLNDTLPMDDETLNDTLPMDDETLNDTLPMDNATLNDTLPMYNDSLDDTLPMYTDSVDDTLPMYNDLLDGTFPVYNDSLDDTLPMDDGSLDDTLSMNDDENVYDDEFWINEDSL